MGWSTAYHIEHGIINFYTKITDITAETSYKTRNEQCDHKLRQNNSSCIRYKNTPSNNFPSTNNMRNKTKSFFWFWYNHIFFFKSKADHLNGFISMKSSKYQWAILALIKLLTFWNWGLKYPGKMRWTAINDVDTTLNRFANGNKPNV